MSCTAARANDDSVRKILVLMQTPSRPSRAIGNAVLKSNLEVRAIALMSELRTIAKFAMELDARATVFRGSRLIACASMSA